MNSRNLGSMQNLEKFLWIIKTVFELIYVWVLSCYSRDERDSRDTLKRMNWNKTFKTESLLSSPSLP